MENNLRAYHFGNYYLSAIQQGIQAAHAQTNLLRLHCGPDNSGPQTATDMVWEWTKQPTMICLNGGNEKGLHDTYELFQQASQFPFAAFLEDQDSLGGSLTNVVILLPEYMYTARYELVVGTEFKTFAELAEDKYYTETLVVSNFMEKHEITEFTAGDILIIDHLAKHRLA